MRPLTWGFVPFRFNGGYFWSARALADGSWMVVRTPAYQRAANVDFLAIVPPPYPRDNVARDRFVPVPVTVSVKGVKGAT